MRIKQSNPDMHKMNLHQQMNPDMHDIEEHVY
jgi:hypothetical protein